MNQQQLLTQIQITSNLLALHKAEVDLHQKYLQQFFYKYRVIMGTSSLFLLLIGKRRGRNLAVIIGKISELTLLASRLKVFR